MPILGHLLCCDFVELSTSHCGHPGLNGPPKGINDSTLANLSQWLLDSSLGTPPGKTPLMAAWLTLDRVINKNSSLVLKRSNFFPSGV